MKEGALIRQGALSDEPGFGRAFFFASTKRVSSP